MGDGASGGDGLDAVILGRSLKIDGGRWHAVPACEDDQEGSVSGLGLGLGRRGNACLAALPPSHCKIRKFQVLCPNPIKTPDMKLFPTFLLAAFLALPAMPSFAAGDAAPAQGAASAPAAAAPVALTKPDLAKGEASFTAVCVACHGVGGNSVIPVNPRLAQQHPEYLVKQLQDFKAGKRQNPIMLGFASMLSDQDMKNIAWWVSANKAQPGFAKDKDLIALGERIYRGGVADRQIPACAGCHSPNGAGIPAQYPRLSGQHAEYAAAQLTAFRDGVRNSSQQMTQVAAKLNDREIRALADYIAGLH